jgi:hypothetical protein
MSLFEKHPDDFTVIEMGGTLLIYSNKGFAKFRVTLDQLADVMKEEWNPTLFSKMLAEKLLEVDGSAEESKSYEWHIIALRYAVRKFFNIRRVEEFAIIGTIMGYQYWYHRKSGLWWAAKIDVNGDQTSEAFSKNKFFDLIAEIKKHNQMKN